MNNLRPDKLDGVLGQVDVLKCLKISLDAAQQKGEPLPHTLFDGPPGVGKTTLALAISNELGMPIQIANGAGCRKVKAMLPYLTKTTKHSILFIDEIHRLTNTVEEILYPVMEDFRIDLAIENETNSIELEPFTIIGATTDSGSLSPPLYDRFTVKHHLCVYEQGPLVTLIQINSGKLNLSIDDGAANEIARRSRGTPRVANNLLKWIQDYSISEGTGSINGGVVEKAATLLGIDENGLTAQDRNYLDVLRVVKKPVGIKTLVASTNIDENTILTQIEPFLLRQKLIIKTAKGRLLV